MKIEISKVVKETVEVELPIYRKASNGFMWWMVYSDDFAIHVHNGFSTSIEKVHSGAAFNSGINYSECTKEEFEEAFNKASELLTKLAMGND